ncbi:MAG TPA: N-acetylmuramoyl-L-alanine amidase [Acidimicrobiales bacterium]
MSLSVAGVACSSGGSDSSSDERRSGAASAPTTSVATTVASTDLTAPTESTEPGATPLAGVVIVVDPGHNGANGAHPEVINRQVDAGGFQKACNTTGAATDDGVTESAINWAVAQQVRNRLAALGAEVVLTRDSDDGVGPCIDERGLMAVSSGADLLVSLHADGAAPDGSGFHVIHPKPLAGYTDATAAPSLQLAQAVRDALVTAGFLPSSYVGDGGLDERGDLGTLNRSGVPAVILEAGNLRNRADAALLTSTDGQRRLADAVTAGVVTFLGPR